MGFLDSVSVPGGVKPTASSPAPTGGFLSNIKLPTAGATARAANTQAVSGAAQVSRANSDYANSIPGLAVNTLKGLWPASGIPEQWQQGVEQSKDQTPGAEGTLSRLSGIATAVSAPLAPVFAPVGKAINAAGEALSNTPGAKAYGIKYGNQPDSQKPLAERIAGDVANAANVAGTVLGGVEAFKPRVKGGFLDSANIPTEEKATPMGPESNPKPKPTPVAEKPLAQTHAEYAKSQGYEPYTPHDELPTIQMGKNESKIPTVQTEAPATRPVRGDLKYEPIKPAATPRARTTPVKVMAETAKPDVPFSAEKVNEPGYKPLTPADSNGPTRTSTLASKVDANAVEKKLTDSLGDLPEYNQVNMKEQASFASDLVNNEPDKAMNIAMGKEPPPSHILPESVFAAVEDKAAREGDVDTLQKLATESNLSTQATAMGQRIRALGERDQHSPVKAIREVSEARKARATPTKVRSAVKEIRDSITPPTKDDWSSFIKDISCNY